MTTPRSKQLALDFDHEPKSEPSRLDLRLLPADDIFEMASPSILKKLDEDKRYERKSARIAPHQLAEWICMFANTTPQGGIIGVGVENDGSYGGCNQLDSNQLNAIELATSRYVPQARTDTKNIEVINSAGERDFIILMRVHPREDRLVETTSGKAFIRYGDQKHELNDEEKLEFRNARQQEHIERDLIPLRYPHDFDIQLI